MYKIIIYFYLLIAANKAICQVPNILWDKNYDYNKQYDFFTKVKQTADSNFICLGLTDDDLWLIKVDINGGIIWEKIHGDTGNNKGIFTVLDILEYQESFIGVGAYNDDHLGNTGALIAKFDHEGNYLWKKSYEYFHKGVLGSRVQGQSVINISDGNIMIAASCFYNTLENGFSKIWLIKVNPEGDTLWTRIHDLGLGVDSLGLAYWEYPSKIIETPDSGFVIVGQSDGPYTSATLDDIFIMKVDKNGTKLWQKIYGSNGFDNAYDFTITKDNGFVIIGYIGKDYSNYEQNFDLWLLKTDENGDTLWTKTYGTDKNEVGRSVEVTEDNGYIIAGQNQGLIYGGLSDIWVLRTNSLGDTLWTRTFGDSVFDIGNSICKTYDNSYLVGGSIGSYVSNSYDGYLILISDKKPDQVNEMNKNYLRNEFKLFQNYPNPFNPITNIEFAIPEKNFVELNVYNSLGQKVKVLVSEVISGGNYNIKFDGNNFSSGIYFYQLKTDNYNIVKKMLLLK